MHGQYQPRISLRDAESGERVLRLNFTRLPVNNPYLDSHVIFIIDGAVEFIPEINEVPDILVSRLPSVAQHPMLPT